MRAVVDVVLASCARLPEPDHDQQPTEEALRAAGLGVQTRPWDGDARFDDARCTVLRATWNYPWKAEAFRRWLDRVEPVTRLLNPAPLVRWNLHKRYLLDLIAAGVPTTPTEVLQRGAQVRLADLCADRGWDEVVVKPAVSAGSFRTLRVGQGNRQQGEEHLASLLEERDVLVQPYLRSVETYGERALIWIDDGLSHAVRKSPRWQGQDEEVSQEAVPIAPEEAALADRALEVVRRFGVPGAGGCTAAPLQARVDVAPGPDGAPVVMELELIEPSLFFPQAPGALDRFVRGVRRRLDSGE